MSFFRGLFIGLYIVASVLIGTIEGHKTDSVAIGITAGTMWPAVVTAKAVCSYFNDLKN